MPSPALYYISACIFKKNIGFHILVGQSLYFFDNAIIKPSENQKARVAEELLDVEEAAGGAVDLVLRAAPAEQGT